MVTIPPQLDENIRSWHGQEGSDWLEALPAAVAGLAARWGLTVGEPFGDDGAVSWVAPATTAGGSEAVLKVFLPDLENRHEADALRHYGGRGAVRLLEDEPGALLLERLRGVPAERRTARFVCAMALATPPASAKRGATAEVTGDAPAEIIARVRGTVEGRIVGP